MPRSRSLKSLVHQQAAMRQKNPAQPVAMIDQPLVVAPIQEVKIPEVSGVDEAAGKLKKAGGAAKSALARYMS